MNDRIKLAEAIGSPKGGYTKESWNPFTSADNDYAVLEWMRERWKPLQNGWPSANDTDDQLRWFWFKSELSGLDGESKYNGMTDYQIGDYARAALKVLE